MDDDFLENKMYRKFTIRDGIKAENARLSVVRVTEVVKALKGPFEFIRQDSLLKTLLFSS